MLNLKHLYYFHIFAKELSTTNAAKKLRITSPALSNQLKQLEHFLGVPLTQRVSGKFKLTEHGRMVQYYTDRIFWAYEELREKLKTASHKEFSIFRVGVGFNVGAQFCFDLLALIENENLNRSEKVQINFENSNLLESHLNTGTYDLILGSFGLHTEHEKDAIVQYIDFPVQLFTPRSLLSEVKIDSKQPPAILVSSMIELANEKNLSLVLPESSSILRKETESFLTKLKVRPKRTIECNSASAIVQLIERGFAIGFAPIPSLLDFKSAENLTIHGPSEGFWNHKISIIVKTNLRNIAKKGLKKALTHEELNQFFSKPNRLL